jgi:hypothetical protein
MRRSRPSRFGDEAEDALDVELKLKGEVVYRGRLRGDRGDEGCQSAARDATGHRPIPPRPSAFRNVRRSMRQPGAESRATPVSRIFGAGPPAAEWMAGNDTSSAHDRKTHGRVSVRWRPRKRNERGHIDGPEQRGLVAARPRTGNPV